MVEGSFTSQRDLSALRLKMSVVKSSRVRLELLWVLVTRTNRPIIFEQLPSLLSMTLKILTILARGLTGPHRSHVGLEMTSWC